MQQIIQKVVAGGVVFQDSKALIVQRSADEEVYPNLWEIPSGKKESLEKIADTVIREVKEETGLETEIVNIIDVFNFTVEKPEETRDVTQINFLLKLIGKPDVKLSQEHQNFAWVEKDELPKYELSDETRATVIKAFWMYKQP